MADVRIDQLANTGSAARTDQIETDDGTNSRRRTLAQVLGLAQISDVTGLQTALDGKAASSHTHTIANVTGLQTALDGKAATGGATGAAVLAAATPVAAIVAMMPVVSIGTNTTLTASTHAGRRLICTAGVTLTVNASTDFAALGDYCVIEADGGNVTVAASGATVNVPTGDTLVIAQHGTAVLRKQTAADTYALTGTLVAA